MRPGESLGMRPGRKLGNEAWEKVSEIMLGKMLQ